MTTLGIKEQTEILLSEVCNYCGRGKRVKLWLCSHCFTRLSKSIKERLRAGDPAAYGSAVAHLDLLEETNRRVRRYAKERPRMRAAATGGGGPRW
jgi:hypothetical protein